MSDLRDELVNAIDYHGFYESALTEHYDGPQIEKLAVEFADAALAVVQKRAEQLANELAKESKDAAQRTNNYPAQSAERGAAGGQEYAFGRAAERIRSAFGLATREESNQ